MKRLCDFRPARPEASVKAADMSPENRAKWLERERAFYAGYGLRPPVDGRTIRRQSGSPTKARIAAWLASQVGRTVSGRDVSLACGLPTGNGAAGHWLKVLAGEGVVRRVHRTALLIVGEA